MFNIASTVIPVSANTANHIVAKPKILSISIIIFVARATVMFSLIILLVFFDISIASGILFILSYIITMSDASIAIS